MHGEIILAIGHRFIDSLNTYVIFFKDYYDKLKK